MKREIKFRAKTLVNAFQKEESKWVYGDYTRIWDHGAQGSLYIDHYIHTFTGYDKPYQIDVETLGQFTGLKDRNGEEIYEGDIVKAKASTVIHPQDLHKVEEEYITSSIYWDSNFCSFDTDFNCYSFMDSQEFFEIVGNIHENPEL